MVAAVVSLAGIAALLLPTVAADGLYTKNSPVLQVDGKRYYSEIAQSNHTTIVEFYAPWCGHCQNLKPAYEKAAKSLAGLAKVAAVNCDEEDNKPFCGGMGVKGFPTLKIVKPGKKPGRPVVEEYQGPRSAKGIVDAVKEKISNHVKRLTDGTAEEWLETDKEKPKAILFTDKGTTSALLKALAIDYLGSIAVGQARDKEKKLSEKFGITSYPTFVLLPGGSAEPIKYAEDLQKKPMSKFLSQVAKPNPDPAPKKPKTKPTKAASAKSDSSKLSKASASHKSEESESSRATQTTETIIDDPTDSPGPIPSPDAQKPIQVEVRILPTLASDAEVQQACLTTKAGTCVLFFAPMDEAATAAAAESAVALEALTNIHEKLSARGKIFPFYNVPGAKEIRTALSLGDGLGLVAVNGKKAWVKRFEGREWDQVVIETWIDALRMGEGQKEKLAEGLLTGAKAEQREKESVESEEKLGSTDGKKDADVPEHSEL
ncbi:hypothetical protein CAC42_5831 [Sphaceloma murrayae]|uniref:protein disulfide-isomerase n=1 Tax=Sphaceloma murrayae TaxID=2082308 RepID=A0A2K1QZB3_9PEZI|nr:hypothetical protein CAC42_5831 [Sphaceloma murrayae]